MKDQMGKPTVVTLTLLKNQASSGENLSTYFIELHVESQCYLFKPWLTV